MDASPTTGPPSRQPSSSIYTPQHHRSTKIPTARPRCLISGPLPKDFKPFSPMEVSKALGSLALKKALGPGGRVAEFPKRLPSLTPQRVNCSPQY